MNLIVALGCLAALSVACGSDDDHWEQHKQKHSLQFHSDHHHNKSKALFHKNKAQIELHNQKFHAKKVSYSLKLTQFSHLTLEEMKQFKGYNASGFEFSKKRNLNGPYEQNFNGNKVSYYIMAPTPGFNLPTDIDWEQNGWQVPVRDQQTCGSCWAFSAVASVEGAAFAQKQQVTGPLSPQQLVDCALNGNLGCDGGFPFMAMYWISQNGAKALATEPNYSYKSVQEACKSAASPFVKVANIVIAGQNSDAALMEMLVKYGPVSIAMDCDSPEFQHLGTGIWSANSCTTRPTHAMTLVGYGVKNGTPYYKIKNQWGEGWGDNGYFKLLRGGNRCGIASMAVVPRF